MGFDELQIEKMSEAKIVMPIDQKQLVCPSAAPSCAARISSSFKTYEQCMKRARDLEFH